MESICYLFLLFSIIFVLTLFLIPKIRKVTLRLNLLDTPSARSSHCAITPSFGGVAFYISYILTLLINQYHHDNKVSLTFLASLSIMFLIGVLDDIKNISPKLKFFGQFIAVALLMVQPEFRILNLYGFMGVYEIPLVLSVVGSMFFLLGLINAFNLLDGIDGLSAITGIIVASFYSFMFYKLGYFYYLCISVTTIATLAAFLRFNFSVQKKIFMGDTGSLSIGLVLGLLTLKLMSSGNRDVAIALNYDSNQLPLLLLGILFVPILDICRVMLIRAFKGVSMFKPDRNHIHHIIVDYGLSHRKASLFIGFVNFAVGFVMFVVIINFNIFQSAFFLFIIFASSIFLLFLINKNEKALKLKKRIKKSIFGVFFLTHENEQ